MTENEEIVGLAILQNQREAAQAFETGSNKGKSALCMPLLAGKPFALSTDNPESVAKWRSLAEHIGASIRTIEEGDGVLISSSTRRPETNRSAKPQGGDAREREAAAALKMGHRSVS
jgi:hypothetical protein